MMLTDEKSQFHEEIQNAPPGRPPYPHTLTTLGADIDVSQSLLQLLASMSCPECGAAEIERLVQTDLERKEIQSLLDLWQSLGRPTSVFWNETRVFVNRILLA